MITEIVHRHGGFVNKFMGDGVLSFFTGDDHIRHAVSASAEICQEIPQLDTGYADFPLSAGIGLHAGEVIMGNVGSKRKMDFTVMGPVVNLASRVEGLSKTYSRRVVVTETVRNAAVPAFRFEYLGTASLRGFDEEVRVYALEEYA
jgi:adenylate cyclase